MSHMDISNSWMINLEDHPGTLPGKKTSCPVTVQNHFTQSPCRKYMKIWNSHMFPMFPSMKFSRIHGWFLPWNLTPQKNMEPPKKPWNPQNPRGSWGNHLPPHVTHGKIIPQIHQNSMLNSKG